MNTSEEIKLKVAAGYRLIGLETRDDAASDATIVAALADRAGVICRYDHSMKSSEDDLCPLACEERFVQFLREHGYAGQNSARMTEDSQGQAKRLKVLIVRDVVEDLLRPEAVAVLKSLLLKPLDGKAAGIVVFVVGRAVRFHPDLMEYATVIYQSLPDDGEIRRIVTDFCSDRGLDVPEDLMVGIVRSLRGVPSSSARRLLGVAYARRGTLLPESVLSEKAATLRKGGMLELVDSGETHEAGGMLALRGYLTHVANIFSHPDEAKAFGVDQPKGTLIAGMPGCGKSLAVKVAARMFALPLLRLDTGRLMGKFNGESEANLRAALGAAEAMAPCVLWIDEIEKAFAGVGRDTDNGVATRLFGSFLTWLNEREEPVYTIATANDILGLPPELMRRGRFDELFFVDFPKAEEAEEILEKELAHRNQSLSASGLRSLANEACRRGFSGADLVSVVKNGIAFAFERALLNKGGGTTSVTADDFFDALSMAKSTCESLGPKVDELRKRLEEFRLTPANVACLR